MEVFVGPFGKVSDNRVRNDFLFYLDAQFETRCDVRHAADPVIYMGSYNRARFIGYSTDEVPVRLDQGALQRAEKVENGSQYV